MSFKHYLQYDTMDCGPTCLKMVARYYGRILSIDTLREKTGLNKNGVSLFNISEAAEKIGFTPNGVIVTLEQLKNEVTLPAILHWTQNHFVVLYKISRSTVYIADPGQGKKEYSRQEFLKHWVSVQDKDINAGVVLILEPNATFYETKDDPHQKETGSIGFLMKYYRRYKRDLFYVALAISISSFLQFFFPFLTQAIVDKGIIPKNSSIVVILLVAQLVLLAGRLFIEYIRSWFLLFINSRINISILSDYIIKLMRLPVSYFDTRRTGDILQRINDHQRIQDFMTGAALEMIFSIATVVVLSITLLFYSVAIFAVFFIASSLYIAWTLYLLRYNKSLNYKRFELGAQNQTQTLQIINGIQDIKLYNGERSKRWGWEKVQAKLFKLNIKYLKFNQIQQSGSFILNEGKNIVITFFAAMNVINGSFTLGMMLAVQAIVGQLNGPISLLINLIQQWSNTKLSLNRLNEIHNLQDEEPNNDQSITSLGHWNTINVEHLNFAYPGSQELVLNEVSLRICRGKTTAIVGSSGSGKTTLIKLLLKFYESYEGCISIGLRSMKEISPKVWRNQCGAVMQENFIFSDSIARNITLGEEVIDYQKLNSAIESASLKEFIDSMPLGYNTLIGAEGIGVSQGQRQRILIARAIYKSPEIIFFDEATNALDATNETAIVRNLERFLHGKTAVIVAHRLNTVKNADNIIVLEKGKVVEMGTHQELVKSKGNYFRLVKDQLELAE